jgi:hypothetical protein
MLFVALMLFYVMMLVAAMLSKRSRPKRQASTTIGCRLLMLLQR